MANFETSVEDEEGYESSFKNSLVSICNIGDSMGKWQENEHGVLSVVFVAENTHYFLYQLITDHLQTGLLGGPYNCRVQLYTYSEYFRLIFSLNIKLNTLIQRLFWFVLGNL